MSFLLSSQARAIDAARRLATAILGLRDTDDRKLVISQAMAAISPTAYQESEQVAKTKAGEGAKLYDAVVAGIADVIFRNARRVVALNKQFNGLSRWRPVVGLQWEHNQAHQAQQRQGGHGWNRGASTPGAVPLTVQATWQAAPKNRRYVQQAIDAVLDLAERMWKHERDEAAREKAAREKAARERAARERAARERAVRAVAQQLARDKAAREKAARDRAARERAARAVQQHLAQQRRARERELRARRASAGVRKAATATGRFFKPKTDPATLASAHYGDRLSAVETGVRALRQHLAQLTERAVMRPQPPGIPKPTRIDAAARG